jgi:uncharacterized protein (DUF779 family)
MTSETKLGAEEILATDAAAAVIAGLKERHGEVSLHMSGSYGVSVVCLPAGELRFGGQDILMGYAAGVPLFMMSEQLPYWQDTTMVLDVSQGLASGFSLESGCGVHFTISKRRSQSSSGHVAGLSPSGHGSKLE